MDKIKMSKKEFDDYYEITGDTEATPETATEDIPSKQDTTPEFLTEEEQKHDDELKEALNWDDETELLT